MNDLNFGMISLSDEAIEALRASGIPLEECNVPLFEYDVTAVVPSEPRGIEIAMRFMNGSDDETR